MTAAEWAEYAGGYHDGGGGGDDVPPGPGGDGDGEDGGDRLDPALVISGSDETWHAASADRACEIIAGVPEVFLDRLRQLVVVDDSPTSTARLDYVTAARVPDMIGRAGAVCMAEGKRGVRPVQPPGVLCATVVSRRTRRAPWKVLEGFAAGPYLLRTGEIVQEPGWSRSTGLWLSERGVCAFPAFGQAGAIRDTGVSGPEEGRRLCEWLLRDLAEFPWATETPGSEDEGLDRAVWLAYLFTLVTRPAYEQVPLFLFEASRPRSGKDLLFKCAEVVAFGRTSARIVLKDNEEENEKKIGSALKEGDTAIVFSDSKRLGDPLLLSLITEGPAVKLRLLGASETIPVPKTLVLGANGNNLTFEAPDLIPRTIALRLVPKTDTPESVAHGMTQEELLAKFSAFRPVYLSAVFNVLRGFLLWPLDKRKGEPCGSFPGWASVVRDCLLWCGYPDVVRSQARLRRTMPVGEGGAMRSLIAAWWACFHSESVTSKRILNHAASIVGAANPDPSISALADALGALTDRDRVSAKGLTALIEKSRDGWFPIDDGFGTPIGRVQVVFRGEVQGTRTFGLAFQAGA